MKFSANVISLGFLLFNLDCNPGIGWRSSRKEAS